MTIADSITLEGEGTSSACTGVCTPTGGFTTDGVEIGADTHTGELGDCEGVDADICITLGTLINDGTSLGMEVGVKNPGELDNWAGTADGAWITLGILMNDGVPNGIEEGIKNAGEPENELGVASSLMLDIPPVDGEFSNVKEDGALLGVCISFNVNFSIFLFFK